MSGIAGKHALVTGGGSGIGAACAVALAAAGARVTVLGRRAAPLQTMVAAGHAQGFVVADLTDEASLADLPSADILVNAAGAAETAPFLKSDTAMFERMMRVNFLGAVAITRAVLPGMIAAGHGRVVHVASTASLRGYAYVSAYTAAKHALLGFVRSLSREVAGKGVTVNALCPGFTETDIIAESVARITAKTGRSAEEAMAEFTRHNPQGRLVQPAEVAAAALFLCGRAGAATNGQAIAIDGGETA
ncbi:SDR family NAD(P)-dependent oxidoreductase [Acetobacteraceae bacterium H6797]|nr:SDR family NAD(P)-dependent oxidoreductase [Acetobacteraceae bacterium H6797]